MNGTEILTDLLVDWVERRQTEDDADEDDPDGGDERNRPGPTPEVPRSLLELLVVDQTEHDRDGVRDVKSDSRDRGRGGEGDGRSERGEGEAEGERRSQPEGPDGDLETSVDVIEPRRDTAISGEGVHHWKGTGDESGLRRTNRQGGANGGLTPRV